MKKDELNNALRKFVEQNLSPTKPERQFVTDVYGALQEVLGTNNCLQIGSYPRFTATTPLHDLDVLYRIGPWPGHIPNPASTLSQLKTKIENDFKNPTRFTLRVEPQTHSITISFLDGDEVFFSIDVVPAYTLGTNEFKQDTYMVPELLVYRQAKRERLYRDLTHAGRAMSWIKTDPRGYIEVAKLVNEQNDDFRKSAKLIKAWKWSCKEQDDEFKLKSFHIEQVVTANFCETPKLEIYDAVVEFLRSLPKTVERPQIPDRANNDKYIDDYVAALTPEQRQAISNAGARFLRKLESVTSVSDVESLFLDIVKRARKARSATPSPAALGARATSFTPRSPWAR